MELMEKDIVVFKDKTEGIVCSDAIVRIDKCNDYDWICLEDFRKSLTSRIASDWDIIEVKRKECYEQCYTTVFKRGIPLRDGDIVVLKNGFRGVVVSERIILPKDGNWIEVDEYDGYMSYEGEDYDISEHYRITDNKLVRLDEEE